MEGQSEPRAETGQNSSRLPQSQIKDWIAGGQSERGESR